jgi:hypothetical protein
MDEFVELRSTEGQILFVRKDAIGAFEVALATARVDGHIKIYINGFKFTVQGEKEELLAKLGGK